MSKWQIEINRIYHFLELMFFYLVWKAELCKFYSLSWKIVFLPIILHRNWVQSIFQTQK